MIADVMRNPVDDYLDALDEPRSAALRELRRTIVELLPDAEECLSYGAPAYKVEGKPVAGFAAFAHHLSYLPHSGTVLGRLADEVAGYETTKGALKFTADHPLPAGLVALLIDTRLRELGLPGS
jgi:uncharacterized protein YdhG (YjbR/CyaY superfamily)